MSRFLVLCISLLFSYSVHAVPYKLAVFGDSLSAGYHLSAADAFYSQLEKALIDKGYSVQVINASKSGETTTGGLARQAELFSQNPDGVLLELGINDALRRHNLDTTQQNLETLIIRFQEKNIPVLLIGMKAPPNYSQQGSFESMYQNLADKYNLFFYPFYMDGIFQRKFSLGRPNPYLLSDNLHPNAEGVSIMVRGILPTVEKFLNAQGIFAN